ncbi:multidrug efflux MFS transporter [Clostridium sp. SHJSY1]|uniref:MDR family MFS transporter n=1 Tax=Clostridium sp. SHJSY1 TaxID=2942483 RepID=UPI002877098C|nr:MDR family MFS transporter [Clostridium sp. SHJSY1]MDS0527393.1 multidrug efflux MFS transporter [Clostridium sp. SHJSY1]
MSRQLNPKLVVSIVYVTAMFMAAMDGTIVNVALATMSKEFQVPPAATSGINVGYLVSVAVFLPMAGWLGDRFGTKKIFLTAVGLFTFASILCGFSNNLYTLNLFRVLQGAGGGLLTPVGMAMLFRTFSPEERPKVSRSLVLPIAIAPALGPVIGGFLVEHLSWRWAFYINFPLGILTLIFGFMFLNEYKEPEAGKLDLPGFLLSAPGFSMLMYALIQGSSKGWNSPLIFTTGVLGFILVSILVIVELRVEKPMLDLRVLTDGVFRKMSIISLFAAAGLSGILFIFPLMYQNMLKATALESGLTTFPEALGIMIASRIMPWSYKKLGARKVISIGLVCTILIVILLTMTRPETNSWILRALFFSIGIFLGQAVVVVQFLTFNNITPAKMGRATTLFNVQNRIGSALGVVLLASILGEAGTTTVGGEMIYQFALFGSIIFLLIGLFFALSIRKADAV